MNQTDPEEHETVSESCAKVHFRLGTDKSVRLNFKTSFTSNSHTVVLLRLTVDWNEKSETMSTKTVGRARNKGVRFAAPPSIC